MTFVYGNVGQNLICFACSLQQWSTTELSEHKFTHYVKDCLSISQLYSWLHNLTIHNSCIALKWTAKSKIANLLVSSLARHCPRCVCGGCRGRSNFPWPCKLLIWTSWTLIGSNWELLIDLFDPMFDSPWRVCPNMDLSNNDRFII